LRPAEQGREADAHGLGGGERGVDHAAGIGGGGAACVGAHERERLLRDGEACLVDRADARDEVRAVRRGIVPAGVCEQRDGAGSGAAERLELRRERGRVRVQRLLERGPDRDGQVSAEPLCELDQARIAGGGRGGDGHELTGTGWWLCSRTCNPGGTGWENRPASSSARLARSATSLANAFS